MLRKQSLIFEILCWQPQALVTAQTTSDNKVQFNPFLSHFEKDGIYKKEKAQGASSACSNTVHATFGVDYKNQPTRKRSGGREILYFILLPNNTSLCAKAQFPAGNSGAEKGVLERAPRTQPMQSANMML